MIPLLCLSFLGGILSTLPPGPLNLRLAFLHLKKQKILVYCFQFGILVSDGCLSILAFYCSLKTVNLFNQFLPYRGILILAGKIIFISLLLGASFFHIHSYFKRHKYKEKKKLNEITKVSNLPMTFLSGVVGTLAIPGLVPFWYFWWIGFSKFIQSPHFFLMFAIIFFGVVLGDSVIFFGYRYFADFLYAKNKNKFVFVNIELIVGLLFLICAVFFIVSAIK